MVFLTYKLLLLLNYYFIRINKLFIVISYI